MEHARAHGYPGARGACAERHRHRDGPRRRSDDARRPRAPPVVDRRLTPARSPGCTSSCTRSRRRRGLPAPLGEGDVAAPSRSAPGQRDPRRARARRDRLAERRARAGRRGRRAHVDRDGVLGADHRRATGRRRRGPAAACSSSLFLRHYDRAQLVPHVARGRHLAHRASQPSAAPSWRRSADGRAVQLGELSSGHENAPSWPAGRFRVTEDLPVSYEEMGARPSSVDSQHPACMPDVSIYRQSCRIPLYPTGARNHAVESDLRRKFPAIRRSEGVSRPQTGVTGFRRLVNSRSFCS